MDDDPHNPINSETASATAHYLSDNEQKHLQHMPGTNGQTFGTVNPELLRAMAEGVTPYLPQLAGADGEGGFNASGVESFKSQDQMASMFSVFDQDHKSGIMITNAAFDQQHHLQVNAAETGNYRGEMFAERLHSAVVAGAERAETYDREHKQFVDSERYNNAGANWDKVSSATSALGAIPPLAAPAAVASVLSPIFKDAMINPNDPSAIQGDDYLTRHFEAAHNNTVNSDNAAILRGLMNANPAMATDPAVERYLTNGQLDPAKFRGDGTPGSGLDFNFDALAERWGFKAGIWSARENKGEDAGKSWEDDD